MEKKDRAHGAHVIVFPYPAQGHINPMLQFSKRLAFKGLRVTFAVTKFVSKSMHTNSNSVQVQLISDGFDDGGFEQAESIHDYLSRFKEVGSLTLAELIKKQDSSGKPVDCLIYDSFFPWALDVAKQFGLVGAPFFTQMCAVNNIYYHVHQGLLHLPVREPVVSIPGLPAIDIGDMPSYISDPQSYPAYHAMIMSQFSNTEKVDWIFVNTFNKLEEEMIEWMEKRFPLRAIGPTIPSMYLDKQVEDDSDYGLHLYKPDSGDCINWLNKRAEGSVVYVSFGSMAALSVEQMEEIAWGLRRSDSYFLWVVRRSEAEKLPSKFVEETSDKGLIVTWCPQLEVLTHNTVGCFVTHCGWNSTLEGVSLGVPMVGIPQWTDQIPNAKFVQDIWGMGLRAQPNEKGIVSREEVERCVREIMEEEKVKEIRKNAIKWRDLAREAVGEGGTSDKNIDEFVVTLVGLQSVSHSHH
ncbi:PREDICTED: UDP-glycosyltransferase 74F2-like [Nelumbo nucifera]|uniref:Glycosyltransferase n=2 Tax=Nelumbo nucifera TaxID=4432 RepID=A0A1U7Z6H8_NELNU|nr:PREDICTED: UDP-glycosyltransferase 74F2-like [Nelumbo nucifera]